jgi:hypothetical protein
MLNSSCLYADWGFTPAVTVICIAIFFWPTKRLHFTASIILAYFFLCYAFQFYLLSFAASTVNSLNHPEWLTLSIPAMAVGGVLVLWLLVWIAEWVIITVAVMMLAQTDLYYISLPIGIVIGFIIWIILSCSTWAHAKHIFMIALFGSTTITIGLGGMLLEASIAVSNLPYECQNHFNMFLTCDESCGSVLVYSNPGVRAGMAAFGLFIMLVRILAVCFCCGAAEDDPEMKSSCIFCDLIDMNQDTWIHPNDRKYGRIKD